MRCHCMILEKSLFFCSKRTFWAIDINKSLNRFNLPGILSHFLCVFFFLERNKIENSIENSDKTYSCMLSCFVQFFNFWTSLTNILKAVTHMLVFSIIDKDLCRNGWNQVGRTYQPSYCSKITLSYTYTYCLYITCFMYHNTVKR